MFLSERVTPFKHILTAALLSTDLEKACLLLLRTCIWHRVTNEFYRVDVPADRRVNEQLLRLIVADLNMDAFSEKLETFFGSALGMPSALEVHRYGVGCGIGAHTDYVSAEVRCFITLNEDWTPDDGAVWILSSDSALGQDRTYVPSLSNTGFIFSSGRNTFHALSTVKSGVSYGITVRFPTLETAASRGQMRG